LRYLLENPRVLLGDKALQSLSHLDFSRSHLGGTFIGTATPDTFMFRQRLCKLFRGHAGLIQRFGQLVNDAFVAAASITAAVIRRGTFTAASGQLRR
jgi:hypothetical protein